MPCFDFDSEFSCGLDTIKNFNKDTVLKTIHDRYSRNNIYSLIGKTLIAVNPYKKVNNDKLIQKVAQTALNQRIMNNQSIITNGESGAGKTVTTKILLSYLCNSGLIGKKVIDCNPILEAFGNATTLRNNNSSRFGKYIIMYYIY